MFGCMQVNSPSDEQMRNTLIEMQPQNYQLIWRWLRVYNVSAFRVNYSLSALLMQGLKCRTGYCGLDFWRLNPWNIHLKGNQYGAESSNALQHQQIEKTHNGSWINLHGSQKTTESRKPQQKCSWVDDDGRRNSCLSERNQNIQRIP